MKCAFFFILTGTRSGRSVLAARLAATLALVCRTRLLERVLLVEEGPGLHGGLGSANALQACRNQLFGGQQAFADFSRGLGGR